MSNYPLATSTWDDKELQAIQSVIDKDIYSMSDSVAQFEQDFSKFIDRKYCVMVSSGSTANLIATAALFYTKNPMLKRGDKVIVPAVSWSTTYFPLQQYGLKLKFVDIDLNTLNYDLDALESAITSDTKMIMVVNLLGNPNDFDVINSLIKDKDIFIFEDNCESMGAEYKGKQTGTFGVVGTFSTFFSHHMLRWKVDLLLLMIKSCTMCSCHSVLMAGPETFHNKIMYQIRVMTGLKNLLDLYCQGTM